MAYPGDTSRFGDAELPDLAARSPNDFFNGLLRTHGVEVDEQIDQVQHVDGAILVDVGHLAIGDRRLAETQQQVDEVEHVDDAVAVDVGEM